MTYWNGTNIPKSTDNAFTAWKKPGESVVKKDKSFEKAYAGQQAMRDAKKRHIVYSTKQR